MKAASKYFYYQGNNVVGPRLLSELDLLVYDGKINNDTLVCHEGGTEWVRFGTVISQQNAPATPERLGKRQVIEDNNESTDFTLSQHIGCLFLFIIIFITTAWISSSLRGCDRDKQISEAQAKAVRDFKDSVKTPEEKAVEKCFSKWDGSCKPMVAEIKKNLSDSSSFKHIETRYGNGEKGKYLVTCKFKAKNAFGGYVTHTARGTLNAYLQTISEFSIR